MEVPERRVVLTEATGNTKGLILELTSYVLCAAEFSEAGIG